MLKSYSDKKIKEILKLLQRDNQRQLMKQILKNWTPKIKKVLHTSCINKKYIEKYKES